MNLGNNSRSRSMLAFWEKQSKLLQGNVELDISELQISA